jgi:hypothetical protein
MTEYEKTGGARLGAHRQLPPGAYFDTNLVSGLARGQPKPTELDALYKMIDLKHEGRLALVKPVRLPSQLVDEVTPVATS